MNFDRIKLNTKIVDILHTQFGDCDITASSTLEDLTADSLDVVELIMALETEFNIEIHDDELVDSEYSTFTVENLVEYIEQRIKD